MLAALVAAASSAASAHAALITLGSDLTADASLIEAHGADTAFWPTAVAGRDFVAPEQGQVVAIRLKGSVLKEPGAADPLNEVHFQSLIPQADGTMKVGCTARSAESGCGTSNPVRVPIDGDPNQVTTYSLAEIGNLCVDKGGVVAFNDEGGFKYGGPGKPLDDAHYWQGAPFRVFGRVGGSSTAQYTANDGTNTGATLHPKVVPGQELLMQVTIATGDDRSYFCGGPVRRADGTIYTPPTPSVAVAGYRGGLQLPYVPKSRSFRIGIVCASSPAGCSGTAILSWRGKKVAAGRFALTKAGFVAMRLAPKVYKALRRSRARKLGAILTLTPQAGVSALTQKITLRG